MVVQIFEKPSAVFAGVKYNTNKIDRNTGELMKIENFGVLQSFTDLKPQDLINYFKMVSAQNKRIKNTQFHAMISARGQAYSKEELAIIAEKWLIEMGYGSQPYFIVFHKDTGNNHVHMVSSRVDKKGKQINRDFEQVRAVRNMDKILGYTFAMNYAFSTRAQFYLILERGNFMGRDYPSAARLKKKLDSYQPDKMRAAELKEIFLQYKNAPDFIRQMNSRFQLDLVFHASGEKKAYGYSVIDHNNKRVFKGSEILSLKYLTDIAAQNSDVERSGRQAEPATITGFSYESYTEPPAANYIRPIMISDDIDDEGVLGRNRRRKKKARTNTR